MAMIVIGAVGIDKSEVSEVVDGYPAKEAGIEAGDVLLAINGQMVKDAQNMLDLIASQTPGEVIPFKVRRQKSEFEITLRIGKRPSMRRER